eukprot:9499290-Pyramimonas_sp.AAC.1
MSMLNSTMQACTYTKIPSQNVSFQSFGPHQRARRQPRIVLRPTTATYRTSSPTVIQDPPVKKQSPGPVDSGLGKLSFPTLRGDDF